jgi:flavorubredoxin
MIVPQHGAIFKGKEMVERFINWIENLQVGVDLLTQDRYRVPV